MSEVQTIEKNIIQSDDIEVVDNISLSADPVIDNNKCCYDDVKGIKIYSCELDPDCKFISGYTEDGTKAKYFFDRGKWFYGHEISSLYLIPFNALDPEKQKELSSLGGKASQEQIRNKRSLNDLARAMLDRVMTEKQIDDVLGDGKNIAEDNTVGGVMLAKMVQVAMSGSFKAAEFVRDTAGYKPKNEVELNAEIMSDSDRSLMDKIGKRLELTG